MADLLKPLYDPLLPPTPVLLAIWLCCYNLLIMNLKPPHWCAHSLERCCRPSSTTEFHPILSSIPPLLWSPPPSTLPPPTCNTLHIISNSTVTPRRPRLPRLALTLPPTAVSKVELKPSPPFAALIAPHHPRLPFTQMWAYVASFHVSPKYEMYFHVSLCLYVRTR